MGSIHHGVRGVWSTQDPQIRPDSREDICMVGNTYILNVYVQGMCVHTYHLSLHDGVIEHVLIHHSSLPGSSDRTPWRPDRRGMMDALQSHSWYGIGVISTS